MFNKAVSESAGFLAVMQTSKYCKSFCITRFNAAANERVRKGENLQLEIAKEIECIRLRLQQLRSVKHFAKKAFDMSCAAITTFRVAMHGHISLNNLAF
jgi:hypothetical protein